LDRPLLEVVNLTKWYPVRRSLLSRRSEACYIKAVDDITFNVKRGEVFGLIGESGSGKTTIGRVILGLEEPTSGSVFYRGVEITRKLPLQELRKTRSEFGAVFQDPYDSLNPRMDIYTIIAEPLAIHRRDLGEEEKLSRVTQILEDVKLSPASDFTGKYPHEISGGQRQRVALARALVLRPGFVVADEPLSMLDVSIRTEMLNLLADMKEKYRLTYLFISHDLAVSKYFCDRIAVLHKGKIVEEAPAYDLLDNPQHPYTRALRAAIPRVGEKTSSSC